MNPDTRHRLNSAGMLIFLMLLLIPSAAVLGADLSGTDSDDLLENAAAVDNILGGAGNDRITNTVTGKVNNKIEGGTGSDAITNMGTVGDDLEGGEDNDTVNNHGAVGDKLEGGGGDDSLYNRGTVADDFEGEDGNDRIFNYGTVGDNIEGNDGDDTIHNFAETSDIEGGDGNDTIVHSGTAHDDILGGSGTDTLGLSGACRVGSDVGEFERFSKTGSGTATIGGDLDLTGVTISTFEGQAGTSPLVEVGGTLTEAGEIQPTGYFKSGANTLISAGAVAGAFTGVNDGSPVLDFDLGHTGTDVNLTVTRTPYENVLSGITGNALAIARTLSDTADTATGDMAAVIGELDFQSAGDMAGAIGQMAPPTLSVLTRDGFRAGRLAAASVDDRLFQERLQAVAGKQIPGTNYEGEPGIWARFIGGQADLDADGGFSGYDRISAGIAGGVDRRFGKGILAGLFGTFLKSDLEFDDTGGSEADMDAFALGLYGSLSCSASYYLDGSLAWIHNNLDSDRRIRFGDIDRLATADYDGNGLGLSVTAGRTFQRQTGSHRLYGGPLLGIDYAFLHQDSYREEGADALNLGVDSTDLQSLAVIIGGRIGSQWVHPDQGWSIVPEFSLGWTHEFMGEQEVDAILAGAPANTFTLETDDPARDGLRLALDLAVANDSGVGFDLRWETVLRSGYSEHQATAGVRVAF